MDFIGWVFSKWLSSRCAENQVLGLTCAHVWLPESTLLFEEDNVTDGGKALIHRCTFFMSIPHRPAGTLLPHGYMVLVYN
jgi:hypothetical protein